MSVGTVKISDEICRIIAYDVKWNIILDTRNVDTETQTQTSDDNDKINWSVL